jgi:hypothetical protein
MKQISNVPRVDRIRDDGHNGLCFRSEEGKATGVD